MRRNTAVGVLVGLVVGAGGVLLAAAVSNFGDDSAAPETLPDPVVTTVAAGPTWVDATETVVGPAVIVPDSLRLEGDEVVFRYGLVSLAPQLGHETTSMQINPQTGPTEIGPDDLDPIFPTSWTIEAAGEVVAGVTSNPRARSARFAVPDDFETSAIDALWLDGYRIPVPVNLEFELSEVAPTEVAPGVSVSIARVTSQGDQTILQVEISAEDTINREHLTIEGPTALWLSAVREAEGRPRYTLRYSGSRLPDPLVLRARGFVWVPVERSFQIELEPDA